ncbi:MAG TPA: nucleoside deaminase [Burkholderiales bacterium]|nr:nucleoside deaminase [Burkholderiales bacterium]
MRNQHEEFMELALQEAEAAKQTSNMACGAVIVRDGQVVARAHNEVQSSFDITAHAETLAIRRLTLQSRKLNPSSQADSGPFSGSLLYATLEPCPMCCWATCIAGISDLVIGARHADLGISFGSYTVEKLLELTGRRIRLTTGILTGRCIDMLRSAPTFVPGPR